MLARRRTCCQAEAGLVRFRHVGQDQGCLRAGKEAGRGIVTFYHRMTHWIDAYAHAGRQGFVCWIALEGPAA